MGAVFILWGIQGPGFLLAVGLVLLLGGVYELFSGARARRLDKASEGSQ